MRQEQGSVAIVDESAVEHCWGTFHGHLDDLLEHGFATLGWTPKRLGRRFHLTTREVVERLLALGLEVEGLAPTGCVSSWDVVATLPPQESYAAIEDCVVDYLLEHPTADHSRIRMFA